MRVLFLYSLCALLLMAGSCSLEPEDELIVEFAPEMPRLGCAEIAPIIFIHGALSASDIWAKQLQRFYNNDICEPNLYVFDWNSVVQQNSLEQRMLDRFIDQVLNETGAEQVNLVGHSSGGWLAYQYLRFPERAAKVKAYAHIASIQFDTLPGPPGNRIPTVNVWSPDNLYFSRIGDIPDAKNAFFLNMDHHQLATSRETFRVLYHHFSEGQQPQADEPWPDAAPYISGKALRIGGNTPEWGATIELYELDRKTGRRLGKALATLEVDSLGQWGPVQVQGDTYYEFFLKPADPNARPVHFYREPFNHNNTLVYLRTPPGRDHPTQLFFSILPKDDNQSVIGVFSASQIVINNRDFVRADWFDLSNEEMTTIENTTNAFFLFDDGDYESSENVYDLYKRTPFFEGVDLFFPARQGGYAKLRFNGRELVIPTLRSETDGLVFGIFD